MLHYSESLTAKDPGRREEALNQLCDTLVDVEDPRSPDAIGLSALFTAILIHDPSPEMRRAALNHHLCPVTVISSALFDSIPLVREAAVLALRARVVTTDTARVCTPSLFAILALETDKALLLSIMGALEHIYAHAPTPPPATLSLCALGHFDTDKRAAEHIFEPLPCFAGVRDLAEHDSAHIRSGVCDLLFAILVRVLLVEKALCAEEEEVARLCFSTLELLMQDAFISVRFAVINVLLRLQQSDQYGLLLRTARLSERSVKCLLRTVEFPISKKKAEAFAKFRLILRIFCSYPLATLSAYSLVENFLRRQLYLARISVVRREEMVEEIARVFEETLVSLAHRNRDFAHVMNLCRLPSEKLLRSNVPL